MILSENFHFSFLNFLKNNKKYFIFDPFKVVPLRFIILPVITPKKLKILLLPLTVITERKSHINTYHCKINIFIILLRI